MLLQRIRKAGIATVILSGAPGEVLEIYCLNLSIDHYRGLGVESARDSYTGALLLNTAVGATKAALAPRYGTPVVLAVGDSDADRPMLELAAAQIVFDNPELLKGATTALHVESTRYDPNALKTFLAGIGYQGEEVVSEGDEP
jgi:phosphoserine phosphatase